MTMKYFGPFHNYIRPLTGAILGDFLGQNRERLAQFIVTCLDGKYAIYAFQVEDDGKSSSFN